MDLRSGHSTMPRRKETVQASPEVEADPSTEEEVPSAELEAHGMGRMVHIENEAANQRPAPGPPSKSTPPPRLDKNKGVLGGPPSAEPTPPPWHVQAGPSRPPPDWNPDPFEDYNGTNGGHNGRHVDPTVNIGGPNGHHSGYNGNNGGHQHSTVGLGNREPYGPQASQYGPRFGGTQWENVNTERRFGPSSYVDFDIELRNLKQTSSVQNYQEKFEDLACMVDWTPKALIAAFVGGLKDEIQIDVRAEPNTELKRSWEAPQRPKQLPAPPRKEEPKPVYRSRVPPNLTREEREEMIRNKQCFWCKENWDPSHRCKNIRIYTIEQESYEVTEGDPPLEIVEIEEAEVQEEPPKPEEPQQPDGSCHMMDDPKKPDAMKVVGRVGNLKVLVLLDTEATHNFVGEHIADRLGSSIEEHLAFRILVANGESLSCTQKCTDVEITLQKVSFKVELLVVPLPNVDIILGVKWLKTLGKIWWDFSTMEMCLPKEGGDEVVFKAVDPTLETKAALKAIMVHQPAAWPRHEVMIECEGIGGGTSWELFDKIKTQFRSGASGQAPPQEGGTDTGQPSTWPRAATDVAESSHRGRRQSANHLVRAEPSSNDPGSGQEGGVGGALQLGSADEEMLGVEAEGGAGESAKALSEVSDFQTGGSSPVMFKPTQAVFEPGILGPT
ncbi:hypothetical protein EJ110_NYTH59225 [Nymphaea thermarum]|nr:hypothetical protein EJ110_NYTH59225 [Nymphaea thermarum]